MADAITLNITQAGAPFVLTQVGSSDSVTIQLGPTLVGGVDLVGPSSIRGFECFAAGAVGDNELIVLNVVPYTFTVSLADSKTFALTPSTGTAIFHIKRLRGGVLTSIGTATFSAGVSDGVLAFSDAALQKHDILLVYAPTPSDSTVADISFLLAE